MSTAARARQTSPVVALAASGFALLLVRPRLPVSPQNRPLLLAAIYGVLAVGSVAATAGSTDGGTVHPALVLAVGLAALWTAGAVTGAAPPAPHTSWTVPLGVGAAIAEEAFFRRFLFGHLVRLGVAVAIVGSAAAFALVHVPVYGVAALWVDFGAGLLFSWQRWASGSWSVPAVTHSAANVLAVL